jgi:hypothetical protein
VATGRSNSGNSAVGLLFSGVSGVWLNLRFQVRHDPRLAGRHSSRTGFSGAYTHKDLDGVPTARPPTAASDYRNRSHRSPAGSFRSSATGRTPRRGVMPPRPTASATTFIAPRMSAALLIGGRESSTGRSRRGATVRSRQSRNAVGSPARASSTALRLSAVASPSSNSCAARVDRLIEPRGRPPGFPDCPFANGRPRSLFAVVVVSCREISVIAPPRFGNLAPVLGASPNDMKREHYGNFIVAITAMRY